MYYNLIITVLLIVSFFMCVYSYSLGVKHGRIVKNGGVPNINPVKVVQKIKQEKETKKQTDMFSEGMQNILNFGEPVEPRKEV